MPAMRLRIMDRLVEVLNGLTFYSDDRAADCTISVEHTRAAVGSRERHVVVINEKALPWGGTEIDISPARDDKTVHKVEWPLVVQGWDGSTADVYAMAATIVEALVREAAGVEDDLLGLKAGCPLEHSPVLSILVGRPVVAPPDESSPDPCFWLPLTLVIVEDRLDPFSWS